MMKTGMTKYHNGPQNRNGSNITTNLNLNTAGPAREAMQARGGPVHDVSERSGAERAL